MGCSFSVLSIVRVTGGVSNTRNIAVTGFAADHIPRYGPWKTAVPGTRPMQFDRRAIVAGLGSAAGLGPFTCLGAETRSGRDPTTREQWDAMIGAAFAGASVTCVRAEANDEGPFYYESSPLRGDIAERMPGEKLRLGITLGGLAAVPGHCFPLAGAVVDIWHTSPAGLYSNVGRDLQPVDTTGRTFLRGHQVTDEKGYVEFDTIVPGWEVVAAAPPLLVALRTTHIHVKAFHERDVLTTQLFFPDPLIDQLYAEAEPYRSHRLLSAPGLDRAYARIRNGEMWLQDVHIAPYANAGYTPHDPKRDRKLLLHRRELDRIEQQAGEQGLTMVPLAMYFKRGKAKVEIGLVRGLKRYDKREKIAERDVARDIARTLRRNA
jgi:SsrA-binding protein